MEEEQHEAFKISLEFVLYLAAVAFTGTMLIKGIVTLKLCCQKPREELQELQEEPPPKYETIDF